MVIKVGINGFGRVGRIIFRSIVENEDIEVKAINDPAIDAQYICYLIKFDSTHGKFKGDVTQSNTEINVNGKLIRVFKQKQPTSIPWHEAGVQYVIEASGMFTSLEKASGHLKSNVKRVIVTSPSSDVPMLVLGVNEVDISSESKVISCASSTLYCLTLILSVLERCGGVEEGFVTCVHAMTSSLKPLDGLCVRGKHWRDHRGIHQNIIPTKTGVCKAVAKILPRLKDRLTGLVLRVPIVNVSVLDITVRFSKNTSLKEIITKVEESSTTTMKNVIKISNEGAVSSDFIGDSHSCVLDAQCCQQLSDRFFKLICWYENEYSYACRVVDTIRFCEAQCPTKFSVLPMCDRLEHKESRGTKLLSSTSHETALKLKTTKEVKPQTDVFKIWYDDHPQQIQKSFSSDTQQRLARVKQEFTKMVHRTEDLLRKSQSNKVTLYATKPAKTDITADVNSDYGDKTHRMKAFNYSDEFETIHTKSSLKRSSKHYLGKDNKPIDAKRKHEFDRISKTSSEEEFMKVENACETTIINLDNDKASVETLIGQASHSKIYMNKKLSKRHAKDDAENHSRQEVQPIYKADKKKYNDNNDDSNNKNETYESDTHIETIVSPHNIHTADSTDESFHDCTSKTNSELFDEPSAEEIEAAVRKRHKQKILEKLDSSSDTDSEVSLRLRERKSQVIQLSELASSHDDLNRLDKICRIMEISDELSDRLFSPLKNKSRDRETNAEWSFKDLCDKIKLDEFCDDVFGRKSVL